MNNNQKKALRKEWEYKVKAYSVLNAGTEEYNKLGKLGWELVNVSQYGQHIFKREKIKPCPTH